MLKFIIDVSWPTVIFYPFGYNLEIGILTGEWVCHRSSLINFMSVRQDIIKVIHYNSIRLYVGHKPASCS
jgi:hypothetical protein